MAHHPVCHHGIPALTLPAWTARLVIVLVLAGFRIALILAWALDVGAGKIRLTPAPAAGEECAPALPGRKRNIFVLAIVGLLISALVGYFVLNRTPRPQKFGKSIAVLPFANFSSDTANAYFADGIQDDVLTNLAKISDLKVISRTSVMPYRGQTHNIREIGKALNVATVLLPRSARNLRPARSQLHQFLEAAGFKNIEVTVVSREKQSPHFQTVFASGIK